LEALETEEEEEEEAEEEEGGEKRCTVSGPGRAGMKI
jgi:hypothetical protein